MVSFQLVEWPPSEAGAFINTRKNNGLQRLRKLFSLSTKQPSLIILFGSLHLLQFPQIAPIVLVRAET
jgi:hypothetical protein